VNPSPTSSHEIRPPKQQTSVGQVFALVAGFLALATIGSVIGWNLTDTGSGNPVASSSTTPAVTTAPPTTPPPSPTPSPSATPTSLGFTLPDYIATQTDFQVARTQLMQYGISTQITFDPRGVSDGRVTFMDPGPGTFAPKGTTVKLSVEEPPPLLAVPDVIGMPCAAAGHQIASTGFVPSYPNGRSGPVSAQDPPADTDPTNPTHHWYDPVAITCGKLPPPVSPSPSDSSDTTTGN
jgi:hypothetical protein